MLPAMTDIAASPLPAPTPSSGVLPEIRLQASRHQRVRSGHPWVFSNEVQMDAAAKALPPGGLVRLVADNGQRLGIATFNPHPLISARMLTRDSDAVIDVEFLATRLARALALREKLYPAPYYRLVHAEADGLPGLVIDRYADTLVVQVTTAGMEALSPALIEALDRIVAPTNIVMRNDAPIRSLEGLPLTVDIVRGAIDGPIELHENGCKFFADPLGGQKTGWFFDQRDNRAFAAALAKDLRVADFYSFSGGFAVAAAAAGAAHVTAFDRSQPALDLAAQAATASGVAERCDFVRGESFALLQDLAKAGETFDMVIVDPPAFVKSKKDLHTGVRGYRKLAKLAAALVAPDGILLCASCSHHVDAPTFSDVVRRSIAEARRTGRILRSAGAAPDHPVHPFLPESAYLKTEVLQLD
jgi:23S rRNA (cytosine1962-C5)-methyltransferase